MSVLLAYGMVAGPDVGCWLASPGGTAVRADSRVGAHRPGTPVAIGPADATPDEVSAAVGALGSLVVDGAEAAAGAGVDLGGGFSSARLAGARGDRRDAVLAALRTLGADGAHRLGDRTATLVALFGPSATKPVGAAASVAIAEGRWAALCLASAASDLLGPEQLEQVLALRAPDGVDPMPRGAASTLAGHLSQILQSYRRPRRLQLVISLWEHVCAHVDGRQRFARLVASQASENRSDELHDRYQDTLDHWFMLQVRMDLGRNPTVIQAARWRPRRTFPAQELGYVLLDAIAATALLRLARTVAEEGLAAGAARHHAELIAADRCLTDSERAAITSVRKGQGMLTRPGLSVHDLLKPLRPGRTFTSKTEAFVSQQLVHARNYGVVVFDAAVALLGQLSDGEPLYGCFEGCCTWQVPRLGQWRAAVGFSAVRQPDGWEQPPLLDANPDAPKQTLAQRLAGGGDTPPAEVELPHDLLWLADLADAIAPFYDNESATVQHEQSRPVLSFYEWRPPPEPTRPRADSVALAAAGVAQLVAFGATPPPSWWSWPELVSGVVTDAAVSEATTGLFPVPAELSTLDKSTVPGAGLTVEIGRDPRQLAEWSTFMGNCIGEPWYAEDARRGICVLIALRDGADPDRRIVANLDIRRRTGGWRVNELRARFNEDMDEDLERHLERWVASLTPPEPPAPEPVLPVPPVRDRAPKRRPAAAAIPGELVDTLAAVLGRELASAPAAAARRVYAELAGQEADAALVALRRARTAGHVDRLHTALEAGLDVTAIWRATSVRPLAAAIGKLDPDLPGRDRLMPLTGDASLLPQRSLRALVRRPEIAPGYAMDTLGRSIRAALGELARGDRVDTLARSVSRHPAPELVCVLAILATCTDMSDVDFSDRTLIMKAGTTAVPGFPATDVLDEQGPWQRALPAAAELGAPVEDFARRVGQGLFISTALLGAGGWPALWRRAHR